MITAGQLLLGLGQIERKPIRLSEDGNHEHDERDDHRDCEQPFSEVCPIADERRDQPTVFDLISNHTRQAKISDEQENRNDREPEREFVGNHLRTRAHAAEKRVFGIGRPTAQDDPVNA